MDTIIEISQKEEQSRLKKSSFLKNLILPSINKGILNNQNSEEKKLSSTNIFNFTKTDNAEFERTFLLNKKLDSLHKDIDVLKIFDSFKNIISLSSINELKSQFNENSKKEIITNNKIDKISTNCLNDISILYSSLPKISNNLENLNKKSKENSDFQSSFNWSPVDIVDQRLKLKNKIKSPRKLRGFSINNRKINFSKSDSIFITNATAEKTFITNQMQKSGIEKDDISKRYFKDKNIITDINSNYDKTINQSLILPFDT